jgi:LytR cell envelope-related transcriptional attenuator
MDDEQPPTGMSGSLSVVRAAGVLALFVAAVAILVAVGTRPSVSGAPSSAKTTVPTTTPTTVPGAGGSTTTTAPATTTTTTAHHGKKGSGSTTTTTTVPPSTVSVVVANATSTNGLAAHYSTVIGAGGWTMKAPIDAATSEATSAVYYAPGFQSEAAAIANSIGVKSTQVLPVSSATPVSATSGLDVIVVIGQDLASTTTTTTASS